MTKEEAALGIRWFDEVWNRGRRDAIAELLSADAVLHECGADSVGPEGFYPYFDRLQTTLSDILITVDDTIAGEDRVWVRWTCSGRHTGAGLGVPPTGRYVRVTGITILRVADRRIVEGWQNWDMLGLLAQVGPGGQKAPTYVAAR